MNDSKVIIKTQSPALYDPGITEYEEFVFQVYAVNTTTDIRGIILDDNHVEKMKVLAADMKIYYNTHESEAEIVKEEEFYSVYDNNWHRVQCKSCNFENQTAIVFFIDRGDEDTFPFDDLHVLPDEFCLLPAQSVKLTLLDLEIFSDCDEIIDCINDSLLGNDYCVKVMSCIIKRNDLPTLSVLMTTVEESTDIITVNNQLLEKILSVFVPQNIFEYNVSFQVDVSHIGRNGIFIHIKSKGLTYLNKLMHYLSKEFLNNKYYKLHHTSLIDPFKIYVAKNSEDNNWYRVKIVQVLSENKAIVEFIDFGKSKEIQKENLVLLESLSKFLIMYPPQAVQVLLDKVSPMDYDKNMIDHFRQITFNPGALIAKKVGEYKNYPVVKMYKRSENNNLLSVNDQIVDELVHRSKSQISFLESPFPEPDIPEDGDYFDVSITMATHPDDLTVQPLNSIFKFKKLMDRLLEVCEEFSGPHLTSNCVKVGGVYAALNRDDFCWYRGYVSKIITETNFLVYACDYGDYKIIKLDDLQPLQPEFFDFPYQAIKAKLVGVAPEIIENWTVYDGLNFSKLTVSKNFVSVISGREVNESGFNSTVLKLQLFNTDTDEDINIADIINSKYNA